MSFLNDKFIKIFIKKIFIISSPYTSLYLTNSWGEDGVMVRINRKGKGQVEYINISYILTCIVYLRYYTNFKFKRVEGLIYLYGQTLS